MRHRYASFPSTLLIALLATTATHAQELPRPTPESVWMSSTRLDRLTAARERFAEQDRLPGAVAVVFRDGKVVHEKAVGYRDRDAAARMETDAISRTAPSASILLDLDPGQVAGRSRIDGRRAKIGCAIRTRLPLTQWPSVAPAGR